MTANSNDPANPYDITDYQTIRAQWYCKLPLRLWSLTSLWQNIESLEAKHAETLLELHQLTHTLAGSSGSFGFSELGRAARNMTNQLTHVIEQSADAGETEYHILDHQLKQIQQIFDQNYRHRMDSIDNSLASLDRPAKIVKEDALIYILEDNEELGQELQRQLLPYGFKSKLFHCIATFKDAIDSELPNLILVDIHLPDGNSLDALHQFQKEYSSFPPTIAISLDDDMSTQMKAAHAEITAFLSKPIDIQRLTDILDQLVLSHDNEPYRILLVDDEIENLFKTEQMLSNSGMMVECLSDPRKTFDAIRRFMPDLVLVDIYMHECNGVDLVRSIRYNPEFESTSLAYYSIEDDDEKQILAMEVGADDFLNKSLSPYLFSLAVAAKAARARRIRHLIVQDSLTHLLNHTHSHELLDSRLSKAIENSEPLAVVMVDLDNFKAINDDYGHQAGDGVLKNLAHLLKQRLRTTDSAGRYGGEKFILILPNTTELEATELIKKIKHNFSRLEHLGSDNDVFKVTLSAGIACYPNFNTSRCLIQAADRALYDAKKAGRNRVRLAEPDSE